MPADFWSSHIDDLLPAYHNGTLGQDERMRVDAHLRRCAACQSASADWSAIANAVSGDAGISNRVANLPDWMSNLEARKESITVQQPSFAVPIDAPTPRRSAWHRFTMAMPALLLVIVLVGAVAATRLLQNEGDPAPTLPAIAAQSSPGTVCTLEASPLDRLAVSGGTLYPDALQVSQRSSEEAFAIVQSKLPTGEPAAQEQVEAVQASLDQLVACINAGSKERALSGFTDDYLRRLRAQNFSLEWGSLSAFIPTYGTNGTSEIAPYQIEEVNVLPDGRLGVRVSGPAGGGDSYGPPLGVYIVLVPQGDRWLVDEAAPIRSGEELTPATIESYDAELTVNDDGFTPSSLDVPPGQITVTVTNQGTKSHSVIIPAHNIRVEVAPGESKQFRIVRQAENPFRGEGVITFRSDLPGDVTPGFTGEMVVGSGVPATPAEGQSDPYAITLTLFPTASTTIAFPVAANVFEPAVVPILADRDVAVTLINNNGAAPVRFIVKELGIDVEVAPGETRTITINAPAGVYAFYSPVGDDLRNGAFGTLVVLADDVPMNGGVDNS